MEKLCHMWSHLLKKSFFECDFIGALVERELNGLCKLFVYVCSWQMEPPSPLVEERMCPSTPKVHPEYHSITEKQNTCLCFWALELFFQKCTWYVWLDGVFMTVQTSLNFGNSFYTISELYLCTKVEHLNENQRLFVQGMPNHLHLFSRCRERVKEQLIKSDKCFGHLFIWDWPHCLKEIGQMVS